MPRTIKQFEHSDVELNNPEGLSQRKSEILYLAAQGDTEKVIAAKLGISPETVKAHLNALREQFDAVNRVDLVSQAWAHGILQASTKNVRLSLLRNFVARVKCSGPKPLDLQAFRAQSRTKQRPRCVSLTSAQKAVAPVFVEPVDGDSGFYDVPAYLRKRIHQSDLDNSCRIAAYAERVRAHIGAAA